MFLLLPEHYYFMVHHQPCASPDKQPVKLQPRWTRVPGSLLHGALGRVCTSVVNVSSEMFSYDCSNAAFTSELPHMKLVVLTDSCCCQVCQLLPAGRIS